MRPCIVVPVYNHAACLPWLVERLRQINLSTILVNDGSDEPCTLAMRTLRDGNPWITLIERPENGGKGAAVKCALREAQKQGYTHVLQVDADGQHDLDDILPMLAVAEANPSAVIVGTPEFRNVPRLRYYARYLTHFWVWINTLSLEIRDSMCGFRVYPVPATCQLLERTRTGNRMDFDPEILVRMHWAGIPIIQRPTRVDYPRDGVSHFRGFHDNLLISWAHTRLFFGMLMRLPRLLQRKLRGHA